MFHFGTSSKRRDSLGQKKSRICFFCFFIIIGSYIIIGFKRIKTRNGFFPYGYIFVLDKYEKSEVVKNFDRLNKLKFSTVEPTAFTQRGLYMLATIIKSPRATNTTLAIVDTFVTVRELANTMEQLQKVEDGGAQQKKLLERSGELMADMIGNNLSTSATETEIELNFAVVKIKHKIIRKEEK